MVFKTMNSMNRSSAERKLVGIARLASPHEKEIQVLNMYSEKNKLEKIQKWQTILDEFDRRRETLNATTHLLELTPEEDIVI